MGSRLCDKGGVMSRRSGSVGGLGGQPPKPTRPANDTRLYEQGVDMVHIGTYVRRWLRWARSGLGTLGARLSERALELVRFSPRRLGSPGCPPAVLRLSLAMVQVGEEAQRTEPRSDPRCGFGCCRTRRVGYRR